MKENFKSGFATLIGRPNVGKSSLVNYILGENRMIVADEAGTTRDAIDAEVDNQFGKFTVIDTAGLRKKGKVEDGVERYAVIRSLAAVERARVCGGYDGDVLGPLHAPLDLERVHARIPQLGQALQQHQVARGEQAALHAVRPAVAHAAGLRAFAPVSATSPHHRGEQALAGIANT